MTRQREVTHQFVEILPAELVAGVLYISGTHNIVAHLCCCGCGEEIVTPLGPAGWVLRYDGRVSLSPSIGNGARACKSHYIIEDSRVRWLSSMTVEQHVRAQSRDQAAARELNLSRRHRIRRALAGVLRRAYR